MKLKKQVILTASIIGFLAYATTAFGFSFYQKSNNPNVRYIEPAPMHIGKHVQAVIVINPTPTVTVVQSNDTAIIRQDARGKLGTLFKIHATLAGLATVYQYDANPAFSAAQQLSDQNTNEILGQIEKIYGTSIKNQFALLWQQHMDLFLQYADALKNNDSMRKGQIQNQLATLSNSMASLFSQSASSQDIQAVLQQHFNLERSVIEAHAGGNYSLQYAQMDQATEQAAQLANVLVP